MLSQPLLQGRSLCVGARQGRSLHVEARLATLVARLRCVHVLRDGIDRVTPAAGGRAVRQLRLPARGAQHAGLCLLAVQPLARGSRVPTLPPSAGTRLPGVRAPGRVTARRRSSHRRPLACACGFGRAPSLTSCTREVGRAPSPTGRTRLATYPTPTPASTPTGSRAGASAGDSAELTKSRLRTSTNAHTAPASATAAAIARIVVKASVKPTR